MPLRDKTVLQNIRLFQLLDDHELEVLAQELDEVNFLAGQKIFSEGDEGGKMYIIQSGRIELFLLDRDNERVTLGVLATGDLFGEFSLLDNAPRSASAKALENTHLLVVDRNDLVSLVTAHPHAALDIMQILSSYVRQTNNLVQERMIRNVNRAMPTAQTFGERLADALTTFASNIYFAYFSFGWFFVWIVWNMEIIPGVQAFDPFPFGLLTTIVSLEAIFLSLFVLISQNRQAARDKIRNDIEYEVNIKAELEVRELSRQIESLQEIMLQHLSHLGAFQTENKKLPPT